MNSLDHALRVHLACHAGSVQRRSNAGRTSLLTGGAQWIRFAYLQAQTDIGQPIQVIPIEIPASSGPFTCVPSQTVEYLIGEDQRLPPGWALPAWQRGIGSRPPLRARLRQASREATAAWLPGGLCGWGVLRRPRWAAGLRTRQVAGRQGSVTRRGPHRPPWGGKSSAREARGRPRPSRSGARARPCFRKRPARTSH